MGRLEQIDFQVISRHTVIKNFDRFWQFIDVASSVPNTRDKQQQL